MPLEVRRKLGLVPGSLLEWHEDGDRIILRRADQYSSAEIHRILFPEGPPKHATIEEMDEGIAEYIREKHARR